MQANQAEESFLASTNLTSLCFVTKVCVSYTIGSCYQVLLGSQEQWQ